MKIRVSTHKPKPGLWLIAFVLFLYGLLGGFVFILPFASFAILASAALLLLGTTLI